MKLSTLDLNQIKALHYLLEEANVGRAALRLGITSAAASNALRRLRENFHDPLLVKQGRGLIRTRMGKSLRAEAREVIQSVQRLLNAAQPFDGLAFSGQLPIAMSEHVAALLLPALDRIVRVRAPRAVLAISLIPLGIPDWLAETAGVLVGPAGAFAATDPNDALIAEDFYEDHYLCAMRAGHPAEALNWDAATYAAQDHILVIPRGRTQFSDIDEQLAKLGLSRRIARVVPSFSLALPLIACSDLITSIPSRYARHLSAPNLVKRNAPFALRPLAMKLLSHPAHMTDARTAFMKEILKAAFVEVEQNQVIVPI